MIFFFLKIWFTVSSLPTLDNLLADEEVQLAEAELEVADEFVEMDERSVSQSRPFNPPPSIGILRSIHFKISSENKYIILK